MKTNGVFGLKTNSWVYSPEILIPGSLGDTQNPASLSSSQKMPVLPTLSITALKEAPRNQAQMDPSFCLSKNLEQKHEFFSVGSLQNEGFTLSLKPVAILWVDSPCLVLLQPWFCATPDS